MKRSAKVAAAIIGVSAGVGLASAQALATGSGTVPLGGLSISPSVIQAGAAPGVIGSVSVSNTSKITMMITASVRPWIQESDGVVVPNPLRTLNSEVALSSTSFSLAAGQKQTITVKLLRTPASKALYGNLDIIGVPPPNAVRGGVKVDYRLIGSLRVLPSTADQRFAAAVTAVHETGTRAKGELLLSIHNAGNTIDPISGTFRLRGPAASVSGRVPSETIVPGATVLAPVARLSGQLPAGAYTATVKLTQNKSTILTNSHVAFRIG